MEITAGKKFITNGYDATFVNVFSSFLRVINEVVNPQCKTINKNDINVSIPTKNTCNIGFFLNGLPSLALSVLLMKTDTHGHFIIYCRAAGYKKLFAIKFFRSSLGIKGFAAP